MFSKTKTGRLAAATSAAAAQYKTLKKKKQHNRYLYKYHIKINFVDNLLYLKWNLFELNEKTTKNKKITIGNRLDNKYNIMCTPFELSIILLVYYVNEHSSNRRPIC